MVKVMAQIWSKLRLKYGQSYGSNMFIIMAQIWSKLWLKYGQNYGSNMVKILAQIRPKIWLLPQCLAAILLTPPRPPVLHCELEAGKPTQLMSPESSCNYILWGN